MTSQVHCYHGYRFPPEIISYAVWLYHRFGLSFRDVEDLLAQRGHHGQLRDGAAVVSAIRSSLRPETAAPSWSAGRHVASRRAVCDA